METDAKAKTVDLSRDVQTSEAPGKKKKQTVNLEDPSQILSQKTDLLCRQNKKVLPTEDDGDHDGGEDKYEEEKEEEE